MTRKSLAAASVASQDAEGATRSSTSGLRLQRFTNWVSTTKPFAALRSGRKDERVDKSDDNLQSSQCDAINDESIDKENASPNKALAISRPVKKTSLPFLRRPSLSNLRRVGSGTFTLRQSKSRRTLATTASTYDLRGSKNQLDALFTSNAQSRLNVTESDPNPATSKYIPGFATPRNRRTYTIQHGADDEDTEPTIDDPEDGSKWPVIPPPSGYTLSQPPYQQGWTYERQPFRPGALPTLLSESLLIDIDGVVQPRKRKASLGKDVLERTDEADTALHEADESLDPAVAHEAGPSHPPLPGEQRLKRRRTDGQLARRGVMSTLIAEIQEEIDEGQRSATEPDAEETSQINLVRDDTEEEEEVEMKGHDEEGAQERPDSAVALKDSVPADMTVKNVVAVPVREAWDWPDDVF